LILKILANEIKVEKNDDADIEIIEDNNDLCDEVKSPKSPEATKPQLMQNIPKPQLLSSIHSSIV